MNTTDLFSKAICEKIAIELNNSFKFNCEDIQVLANAYNLFEQYAKANINDDTKVFSFSDIYDLGSLIATILGTKDTWDNY